MERCWIRSEKFTLLEKCGLAFLADEGEYQRVRDMFHHSRHEKAMLLPWFHLGFRNAL
jgi:hypothetical protein